MADPIYRLPLSYSGACYCSTSCTITPPPVIDLTVSATYVASVFKYQITATNSPTSYSATGLPPGVNVNTTTGLVTGTVTVAGKYTITVSATNAGGTGSAVLTITLRLTGWLRAALSWDRGTLLPSMSFAGGNVGHRLNINSTTYNGNLLSPGLPHDPYGSDANPLSYYSGCYWRNWGWLCDSYTSTSFSSPLIATSTTYLRYAYTSTTAKLDANMALYYKNNPTVPKPTVTFNLGNHFFNSVPGASLTAINCGCDVFANAANSTYVHYFGDTDDWGNYIPTYCVRGPFYPATLYGFKTYNTTNLIGSILGSTVYLKLTLYDSDPDVAGAVELWGTNNYKVGTVDVWTDFGSYTITVDILGQKFTFT